MVAVFDTVWDFAGSVNAPGTTEEVFTNLRFKLADNNTQDTADPVVIPTAGSNYSMWKHVYLDCTTAPDTQVDNMEWFTDNDVWTGVTYRVGDGTQTKTAASSAGYDPGQALIITTHDTITTETDASTFVTGAARTVSISETSNIINAVNEKCDYVVTNLEVQSTATQGTQAAITDTFRYDEI